MDTIYRHKVTIVNSIYRDKKLSEQEIDEIIGNAPLFVGMYDGLLPGETETDANTRRGITSIISNEYEELGHHIRMCCPDYIGLGEVEAVLRAYRFIQDSDVNYTGRELVSNSSISDAATSNKNIIMPKEELKMATNLQEIEKEVGSIAGAGIANPTATVDSDVVAKKVQDSANERVTFTINARIANLYVPGPKRVDLLVEKQGVIKNPEETLKKFEEKLGYKDGAFTNLVAGKTQTMEEAEANAKKLHAMLVDATKNADKKFDVYLNPDAKRTVKGQKVKNGKEEIITNKEGLTELMLDKSAGTLAFSINESIQYGLESVTAKQLNKVITKQNASGHSRQKVKMSQITRLTLANKDMLEAVEDKVILQIKEIKADGKVLEDSRGWKAVVPEVHYKSIVNGPDGQPSERRPIWRPNLTVKVKELDIVDEVVAQKLSAGGGNRAEAVTLNKDVLGARTNKVITAILEAAITVGASSALVNEIQKEEAGRVGATAQAAMGIDM